MADIVLDPSQERAVEMVLREPCSIVTGGPGVGKTTILRTALDRLDAMPPPERAVIDEILDEDSFPAWEEEPPPPRYLLGSPTGKAAKRMAEATGREAKTIHRLLGYSAELQGFAHNSDNPLEAPLVVVDEASMLDVQLARHLFDAVDHTRTRVVLVGDANQLPSVGPGRVFADLVESGKVPVARLTTLHRAAEGSWICRNAPRVLAGELPELAEAHDFRFVECEGKEIASTRIVDLLARELPAMGVDDAQVLTPQNPGTLGVEALNRAIQERVNPRRGSEPTWKRGDHEFRPRDRVIQTRNNYQLGATGVFNGEVGTIATIAPDHLTVDYGMDSGPVRYTRDDASDLRLAYALTIHKSQGSEWPWVVVVCHSTHHFMLARQLFYTAITRAKRGVILVGDRAGLKRAIENNAPAVRNTSLVERLAEENVHG